ncbi:hypothetical protein BB561_005637 [Smittium simulii]|uniref:Guided entry of tail-anchored proteins 1 n=1 Tax=Smittium simulii TaxID=133385 RepID=A0A2T9Y9F5_9FUNG|nr:hypothetical protein BB561_005637 [Smittium simulii]
MDKATTFLIFLIELLINLISYCSYSYLSDVLYNLWCKISNNTLPQQVHEIKQDIKQLRLEIKQVSSVDEFSRWAKINRKLEKSTKLFDTKSSDLGIQKTSFKIKASLFIMVAVYGIRLVILYLYYRVPVIHLPASWFYPFGWLLSYPGAPSGTLSVFMWSLASNRVSSHLIRSFNNFFPIAGQRSS